MVSSDPCELRDEFLDEDGVGELFSERGLVLDGDLDDLFYFHLFLDYFVDGDGDYSGEFVEFVEFGEE